MKKLRRLLFLTVGLATLFMVGCLSAQDTASKEVSTQPEAVFTLQLLHFADIDGNEELALGAVGKFSALVSAFRDDTIYGGSTLVVSSGDNIIPGPRFYAAEQSAVRAVTGSNEPGHADIAFLNAMGVVASAIGNHELDAGPGELVDAMSPEEKGGVQFPGALFPYLSANLVFDTDKDASEIVGPNGATVEELAGKFAGTAVATVNGEKIGLVGATTPILDTITTTGGIQVLPADRTTESLAAVLQPHIDALVDQGIDKIVLLAHMQQIDVEKRLAGLLKEVDIIVAGGSNTRMGDKNDVLFPGDDGFDETYPLVISSAAGEPTLVVNVDGDYKYLGRLVVGFDSSGVILPQTLDDRVNGAWAATEQNVARLKGTAIPEVVTVQTALQGVITAQFGNVLGYTSVYLDGRRSQVRTEETNLGNLTADANLWYANQLTGGTVDLSIKNGGGIRTEIGSAIVPPGSVDYENAVLSPPVARTDTGTPEGAITEGHLRATLRFDNGLVVLTATAEELVNILEYGVAATEEGATPGQFPQVAGMRMAFDVTAPAGNRITSLDIVSGGRVVDTVVSGGSIQGDPARTYRFVTLNFLANGGDGYPFDQLSQPNRINLYEGAGFGEEVDYPDANLAADPNRNTSFSYTGGEQDALAEYLLANHGTPAQAYSAAETPRSKDMRIRY
jgi:2',3'-cyclic-nucleotide 2'-phosphodiesterase (5'-nucleotidase family)